MAIANAEIRRVAQQVVRQHGFELPVIFTPEELWERAMEESIENPWEQSESDSVVREVRSVREAYAARFNYDLQRMVEDLKAKKSEQPERCAKLLPLTPATAV